MSGAVRREKGRRGEEGSRDISIASRFEPPPPPLSPARVMPEVGGKKSMEFDKKK